MIQRFAKTAVAVSVLILIAAGAAQAIPITGDNVNYTSDPFDAASWKIVATLADDWHFPEGGTSTPVGDTLSMTLQGRIAAGPGKNDDVFVYLYQVLLDAPDANVFPIPVTVPPHPVGPETHDGAILGMSLEFEEDFVIDLDGDGSEEDFVIDFDGDGSGAAENTFYIDVGAGFDVRLASHFSSTGTQEAPAGNGTNGFDTFTTFWQLAQLTSGESSKVWGIYATKPPRIVTSDLVDGVTQDKSADVLTPAPAPNTVLLLGLGLLSLVGSRRRRS